MVILEPGEIEILNRGPLTQKVIFKKKLGEIRTATHGYLGEVQRGQSPRQPACRTFSREQPRNQETQ